MYFIDYFLKQLNKWRRRYIALHELDNKKVEKSEMLQILLVSFLGDPCGTIIEKYIDVISLFDVIVPRAD